MAPPPAETTVAQRTSDAGMIREPGTESLVAPLFERIGGDAAVEAAVSIFYARLVSDPLVARFFEGLDMGVLMRKQVMFLRYAFGGAPEFQGKSLVDAHRHLMRDKGLGLDHFDAVAGHLVATLQQLGVAAPLIQEAAAIVLSTRPLFDPATLDKSA